MQIKCLTTFIDGTDRFELHDTRTVDDERGAYFVDNGWAVDLGATAVNLDVQSSNLKAGDSNG